MKHLGILATTPEGAALCFRTFCLLSDARPGRPPARVAPPAFYRGRSLDVRLSGMPAGRC
jgi:hypothetical protein